MPRVAATEANVGRDNFKVRFIDPSSPHRSSDPPSDEISKLRAGASHGCRKK
jgi:hypothetical protein